jgi:hypothetical protein
MEETEFRVYPNPVNTGTPVQLGAVANRVDVVGITGKLLHSEFNTSIIKTDKLNRGVYFMRIQSDNGTFQTTKLIVK